MTNEERAAAAQFAADEFQRVCKTDDEDVVADLICDLLHLAHSRGEDPLSQANRGIRSFIDETMPDCGWSLPNGTDVFIHADPLPGPWSPDGGDL